MRCRSGPEFEGLLVSTVGVVGLLEMTAKLSIKVVVVTVACILAVLVVAVIYWIAGPVSNDRYAVYSAYLEHERSDSYHGFGGGNVSFQILNHTFEIPTDSPKWAQEKTLVRREMALRSRFHQTLNSRFMLKGGYTLVAKADFLTAPSNKRPLGLESFSDVVFEDYGTEAHFYFEHSYVQIAAEEGS